MDPPTRTLVERIHGSGRQCALVLAGAGAGAAACLLEVAGASRSILDIQIPYAPPALAQYLHVSPQHACSLETAIQLVERAADRARDLATIGLPVGLACTASLASDRPKRGDHRFFVATRTWSRQMTYSLVLSKGARSREAEAAIADTVVLNALAEACEISERLPLPLLPEERIAVTPTELDGPLERFWRGQLPHLCIDVDGRVNEAAAQPRLLVSGAFNPLHEGHRQLAAVAARITGLPPAFELSIVNADKPELQPIEALRRAEQFRWLAPLWLTRAATFVEKTSLFPGAIFVIGSDTAARVLHPRYYGSDQAELYNALASIQARGCKFLVACRLVKGQIVRMADLSCPPQWADLFAEIPEELFRLDQSSTELRGRNGPGPA